MRALEARAARLETAVAELRHARSPAVSWLRLVRQLGTPADVACACGPCRADLEDQLLAYGAEACRLTEQGAARLQTEASQNPVRLLAAVLTYPPGQEAPRGGFPWISLNTCRVAGEPSEAVGSGGVGRSVPCQAARPPKRGFDKGLGVPQP